MEEMLESGDAACKAGTLTCAVKENCANPVAVVNQLTYKLLQVKGDRSFVPVIEVEHLPLALQSVRAFEDDVMYLHSEEIDNWIATEEIPSTVDHYNEKGESSIFYSDAAEFGKEQSNYGFIGGLSKEIAVEENLNSACSFTGASPEKLLGTIFPESAVVDCGSSNESVGGCSHSEIENPNLEKHTYAAEVLDFSDSATLLPQTTSDQRAMFLENMSIEELRDTFIILFGWDANVEDKQWLKHRIFYGLENLTERGNASAFFEGGLSSVEAEDSMSLIAGNGLAEMICCSSANVPDRTTLIVGRNAGKDVDFAENIPMATSSKIGRVEFALMKENTIICGKRLRNPTGRNTEEIPRMDFRYRSKSSEIHVAREEPLSVREANPYQWESRTTPMVHEELVAIFGSQVPHGRRVQRGRPRKNVSWTNTNFMMIQFEENKEDKPSAVATTTSGTTRLLDSASFDVTSDDSSDDLLDGTANNGVATSRKRKTRRKHHKHWTLSEVMKLIEGVSQCGVGRWTDIKKLFFSASARRTSVDLKDKWRNLLRTSGIEQRSTRVKTQKHMLVQIPQSVLLRIKELAVIHPYPRRK